MRNEPSRFNFANSKLIYQLANSHQRQICRCTEFLPWTIDTLYQIQTFTTAWVCMKAPDYIWLKWCWRGVTITKLNALFLIHLYCCWNADKSWNGLIALIATGKYHPRPMASNLKRKGREEEKGLGKIVDRSCLDPGSQNAGHFFLENDGEQQKMTSRPWCFMIQKNHKSSRKAHFVTHTLWN